MREREETAAAPAERTSAGCIGARLSGKRYCKAVSDAEITAARSHVTRPAMLDVDRAVGEQQLHRGGVANRHSALPPHVQQRVFAGRQPAQRCAQSRQVGEIALRVRDGAGRRARRHDIRQRFHSGFVLENQLKDRFARVHF